MGAKMPKKETCLQLLFYKTLIFLALVKVIAYVKNKFKKL